MKTIITLMFVIGLMGTALASGTVNPMSGSAMSDSKMSEKKMDEDHHMGDGHDHEKMECMDSESKKECRMRMKKMKKNKDY